MGSGADMLERKSCWNGLSCDNLPDLKVKMKIRVSI